MTTTHPHAPPAVTPSPAGIASARAHCAPREVVFELTPRHYNVPDAVLLADLRAVVRRLGARTVGRDVYDLHGRFAAVTLSKRFGTWGRALAAAGFPVTQFRRVDPADLAADIRRVARALKVDRLERSRYLAHGKYSYGNIVASFENFGRAARAAGIQPGRPRWLTADQLLDNLEHVWRSIGRQPTAMSLAPPVSRYSVAPYIRAFGTLRNALQSLVTMKAKHGSPPTRPAAPPLPLTPPPHVHKTPRTANWRLRFLTLQRDDYRCRACGRSPATDRGVRLQVDHVKPWSAGGETILPNLQTLCDACNGGKSNLRWKRRSKQRS